MRRRSGASQRVLYTKETSVVLGSGVKSNFIPPVTYLHRSTNSKQPLSMVPDSKIYWKFEIDESGVKHKNKLEIRGIFGIFDFLFYFIYACVHDIHSTCAHMHTD